MVNKASASITRSREEPNLKRPTIPLRFRSKPADRTWLSSITTWVGRGASGTPQGSVQVDAAPYAPVALGLYLLICEMGIITSILRHSGED